MSSRLSRETIIAAQLADPTRRCRVGSSQEVDWPAVLAILDRNKVPLIGLAGDPALAACPLVQLPAFQRIADEQRRTWLRPRDEYAKVRERFLERGSQSVLFKSVGLPPSFPYTSDNLDVLVRPEHIQRCREILNQLRYVELRNVEEPQKFLFRKFKGGVSVSAIHLHGTVGWGVPFLDDAALWKRVRVAGDDPLVLAPAPGDALLITIAHAFYEDKRFSLRDVGHIRHCLQQGNLDFSDIEMTARERGWQDGLAFCLLLYSQLEDWLYGEQLIPGEVLERARRVVKSNGWLSRWLGNALKRGQVRFPFRLSFLLGKLIYYRKILNDSQRSRVTRIADVIRTLAWGIKLKLRIRGQRGMIVSFSGIDGSGKTVHVRSLASAFRTADVKTRTIWSRFGSSAQKGAPRLPAPEPVRTSDTAAALARRRRRLRHPVVRLGWLLYNLTDIVLRYNRQVRMRRWLGDVVICDRYTFDAAVEISASLPDDPGLSRWAERVLTRLCPRPDVAWLMDAPADLTVARQADENRSAASAEELSRHRAMYMTLTETHGLKVLRTNSSPEDTTSQVVHETLVRYYDHYSTGVNALLLSNPNQMNPQERA